MVLKQLPLYLCAVFASACQPPPMGGERCEGNSVVRCQENAEGGLWCTRFDCPKSCVVAEEQGADRAFCAASATPDPVCMGADRGVQRCADNRPVQCRSGYREHEHPSCGDRYCVEAIAPECALSPNTDAECLARVGPGGACQRAPGNCSFCDGSKLVSCRDGYRLIETDCGSKDLCHTFDEALPGIGEWSSATCIKSKDPDLTCKAAQPADVTRFATCQGTELMLCVDVFLTSVVDCAPGTCVDTGPGWCEQP